MHKPDANYFNMMDLHRGYRHYYHFLLDRLPKLYYLLHRFDLGRAPVTVLTNTDLPPFQRDIYRFLAQRFPNIRFEAVPQGERWRVRRLYDLHNVQPVSHALASAGFVEFMRSLIIEGYGLTEPTHRRRLYVSRADAKLRRITNESQLLPTLARQGFEAVVPGTLPLREQVALFMGAEAIAGPHGAGLANLLFAPSSARVLEILPSSMLREHYFLLSISMGQAYRALIGGAAGFLQHFAVDPAQVERSLQELMHAPAPFSLCTGRPASPSQAHRPASKPQPTWARLTARLLRTRLCYGKTASSDHPEVATLPSGGDIDANAQAVGLAGGRRGICLRATAPRPRPRSSGGMP